MNSIILSLVALIPAVFLCWYIYSKDRVEKEPLGLLGILFAVGAVIYIPVIYVENSIIGLLDRLFASQISYSLTGVASFESASSFAVHSAACAFLGIALIEEAVKWILLYFITSKNKNFDHLFDGIVYAVFLSLGFAAMENVFYAVRDGWTTFVLRSLTSVPGHMTFGVLMGYCYTMWHTYLVAKEKERELSSAGTITLEKPFNSGIWLAVSVLFPVVLHGCYSFLSFFTSDIMLVIFYGFIILLYGFCFYGVHQLSDSDSSDDRVADRMISKKYPYLNSFGKKTRR